MAFFKFLAIVYFSLLVVAYCAVKHSGHILHAVLILFSYVYSPEPRVILPWPVKEHVCFLISCCSSVQNPDAKCHQW